MCSLKVQLSYVSGSNIIHYYHIHCSITERHSTIVAQYLRKLFCKSFEYILLHVQVYLGSDSLQKSQ